MVKFFSALWTIIMSIGIIFIETNNQLAALRAISIIFGKHCVNGKFSIAVISFYRFLITTITRIVIRMPNKLMPLSSFCSYAGSGWTVLPLAAGMFSAYQPSRS